MKRVFLSLCGIFLSGSLFGAVGLLREAADWKFGDWNTTTGTLADEPGKPDKVTDPEAPGSAVKYTVNYPGSFSACSIDPQSQAPGTLKKISMWIRTDSPEYFWIVKFADSKNQNKVGNLNFEYSPKPTTEWRYVEFELPERWPKPMRLSGITGHNWGGQLSPKKAQPSLYIYDMKIETDSADIKDPKKLLSSSFKIDRENNLYNPGEKVKYTFKLTNYLDNPATGTLKINALDPYGESIFKKEIALNARHGHKEDFTLEPKIFGSYRVEYEMKLDNGMVQKDFSRFAVVPAPRELTNRQKMESPWGLDIHSAGKMLMSRFTGLGIVWVRDFAYNYDWVANARESGYTRWPWFDKMDKAIRASGLKLLPSFQRSMTKGIITDKKPVPTKEWLDEMIEFAYRFSYYPAWELDNEYNLHHARTEEANNWSSYKAYHKAFAEAFRDAGFMGLIVEQGNAGVHPERTRDVIKSGAFDLIDVVNGHAYCGVSAPELANEDKNAHGSSKASTETVLLFDNLREYVDAASSDGKKRQAWITEFGWDTLAGHVVTETEQAAYLQRGYMTGIAAGIDKLFWFFHGDDTQKAIKDTYFDGCGLYDPKVEPKPSAASFAFMTKLLRKPKVIGIITPADNARGYLIEDDGKLFAMVYMLDVKGKTPEVELTEGELFDMYGNPLPHGKHKLTVAPVWITGLTKESPLYAQAIFDLKTRYMPSLAAGDAMTSVVTAKNTSGVPVAGSYKAVLPQGWQAVPASGEIKLAPGEDFEAALEIKAPGAAVEGIHTLPLEIDVNGTRRVLDLRAIVSKPATPMIAPFNAGIGEKIKLKVSLRNNSLKAADFTLKPELPKGWRAVPESVPVRNLASRDTATVDFELDWNPEYGVGESAKVFVLNASGEKVSEANITPPSIKLAKLSGIKLDADFADWPAKAKLPDWALGSSRIAPPVEVRLGYDKDNLYVAYRVGDSKVNNTSPTTFWSKDCLELFVDAKNAKQSGGRKDFESQVWIVPDPDNNKVFIGRWNANKAEEFTVESSCRRVDGGYIAEVKIPFSEFKDLKLESGKPVGLNVNLTAHGRDGNYEVYWKTSKFDDVGKNQKFWGTAIPE